MGKVLIDKTRQNYVHIECPGCKEFHMLDIHRWSFNGDLDKPTFSPSLLVKSGHYADKGTHDHPCWCDYNAELIAKGKKPRGFRCYICHSFITDGRIQFLTDSTHHLAGQTVDLPEVKEED